MTKVWYSLITEPFRWIFLVFFQPRRFEREFDTQYPRRLQRFAPLLRLIIPMFLTALPFAIIGRAILLPSHLVSPDIANFFFTITVGISLAPHRHRSGIVFGMPDGIADTSLFGIAGGIVFGIAGGIVFGIAVGITNGITGGITVGITGGIVVGITNGITVGIIVGIGESSLFGICRCSITVGIAGGITVAIAVGIAGAIAGIIGGFRLPFYLVSGPSAYKAYYASRHTPAKVFDYLHRCSLHWDERVYLPLPYLKQTLLIAYDESAQKALEEIAFIVAERPQQARAARAAVLEIVMRDLEQRDNLEKMAGMADWLTGLLPPEMKLADPRGTTAIARMSDASRDAMRAIAPIGLQGRRKALDDLQANLRKVYPQRFS